MDLQKYQKIFSQESDKYLKELDRLLMSVEKDLSNLELWADIHGKIHSIKGMARALSMDKITALGHAMENWCKQFQEGAMNATSDNVQLIFQGGDLLRLLVVRMGDIDSADDQRWYDSLISQLRKGPEATSGEADRKRPLSRTAGSYVEKMDYVRVRYSLIEELLGLSQEIMLLEKSLPPLSLEQISYGLKNWIDDYTSMLKGLHFRLAQLRLVSVADFADIFVKTIRNLGRENNKAVKFEVIGGELEADITLFERLREPFIHIFRNSIAHGIERSEERVALGKDPEGKIVLDANRRGDSLIIKLSDDGRGIDSEAIKRYLKSKKSMSDDQIAQMSREELFDTILSPDFSSSSITSDMAGRGIGMNVVAQAIEYLGGTLTINSEPKKGTEFTIKLPVSLSVIYAITFRIGDYTLSIPTSNVETIDQIESVPSDRDSTYNLKRLLGIQDGEVKLSHVLKVRYIGTKNGSDEKIKNEIDVIVGDIIGNKPMMVMPVGELLAKVNIFSGVGIMENGDISILLDVENLPEIPVH
jgi:two-component system chemotaxis sensor kinase CheA